MSGADADADAGAEADDHTGLSWIEAGVVLAVLWLLVRGVALEPVRLAEEGLIGLAISLPVAYAVRRFYEPMTGLVRRPRVLGYVALYTAAFVVELVTANVDVARRVLAPSMPIEPAVVEVPLRVESDLAITTIANSITLTPGTLTMDYDRETNALYVHSIDGSDRTAILEPIRRWEDYALAIFDERLKPGDPVPREPRIVTDGGGHGADADADAEEGDRGD
jgi:multicomponent Na+:H+ antiporter subunit E